jgi:1-acyl-sn-glycerol-3-phosphate acyltransferase
MAFFRAIFYYLFIAVGLFVVGIPFMFYKGVLCRRWADSTRICIPFFNVLFKLSGIKIEIEGKENIPSHKKFVLIANHQSFLDINVIWPSITMTSFIAKAELWKIPVFGWVLTKIGCIPVHRNPRKNLGMGATVKKRLEDNVTISVFPEGHRSNDGHMLPFQNGIFRMAKENRLFQFFPNNLLLNLVYLLTQEPHRIPQLPIQHPQLSQTERDLLPLHL